MTTTMPALDRQLLVAVNRYRRAHDWVPTREGFRHDATLLAVDWHWPWRVGNSTGKTFRVRLLYPTGAPQQTSFSADVTSVQDAVDAAVVAGVLPLAFSSAYRAGLDTAQAVLNTPRAIPGAFLLALLRQAAGEDDSLDGIDDLVSHVRTEVYRQVIEACWIAAQASALGWDVQVNDLGDRLLVLDRATEGGLPNRTPVVLAVDPGVQEARRG